MKARPVFLKLSLAVFIVLLPFLAYQVWDVVEAARLRSRVERLKASGAPIVLAAPALGGAELAARYYQAAAALTANDSYTALSIEERNRVLEAVRNGVSWPPDVLRIAKLRVEQNREALEFVDRAAPLPFQGVRPGTTYDLMTMQFVQLAQACAFRAAVLASEGRDDAVADSLYSEVRLMRAVDSGSSIAAWTTALPWLNNVAGILGRAKPSRGAVDRVSAALEALDRDDRMKDAFIRLRASMLSQLVMARPPSLQPGAFVTHLTVRSLDAFDRIIAAANQPWTTRVSAINAVGIWPQPDVFSLGSAGSKRLVDYTRAVAHVVQRIRCARLSLEPQLGLIDPFTGARLEASSCHI